MPINVLVCIHPSYTYMCMCIHCTLNVHHPVHEFTASIFLVSYQFKKHSADSQPKKIELSLCQVGQVGVVLPCLIRFLARSENSGNWRVQESMIACNIGELMRPLGQYTVGIKAHSSFKGTIAGDSARLQVTKPMQRHEEKQLGHVIIGLDFFL